MENLAHCHIAQINLNVIVRLQRCSCFCSHCCRYWWLCCWLLLLFTLHNALLQHWCQKSLLQVMAKELWSSNVSFEFVLQRFCLVKNIYKFTTRFLSHNSIGLVQVHIHTIASINTNFSCGVYMRAFSKWRGGSFWAILIISSLGYYYF